MLNSIQRDVYDWKYAVYRTECLKHKLQPMNYGMWLMAGRPDFKSARFI